MPPRSRRDRRDRAEIAPAALTAPAAAQASRWDPDWIALRVSYGFNGVVVRHADLPSLGAHLVSGYARRPPDHLLYEWFSGKRPETKCARRRRPPPRARALRGHDGNTTLMYPDSASLAARVTRRTHC